ncbi:hypothetical protein [Ehrlichia ruminantium]|nr:hypothetical protein [Ehrlichia ruminantium]
MGNNDTQSESIKDTVIKIVIDCLKLKDEQQATLSGSTNLAKDLRQ